MLIGAPGAGVARLRARRRGGRRSREAQTTSSRLVWQPPARTISLAGLHGGAGASTLCLLLAEAIAAVGGSPALAVDLAGRSRGGLAVLGGAAGETTAEGTCALAVRGGQIERPFGVTEHGVRIIGTHPDGVEEIDRNHEAVVARLVEGVTSGVEDHRLAELARLAVRQDQSWQALRWDSEQVAEAVGRVLDQAVAHHALVAVDLGMLDSDRLAKAVEMRTHLHVWVLPGRASSLEIAERRLPRLALEPAGAEAIAVWQTGEASPSAKRLSALGDLRGCPVVRVGNHGDHDGDLPTRMARCLAGITELCELAR